MERVEWANKVRPLVGRKAWVHCRPGILTCSHLGLNIESLSNLMGVLCKPKPQIVLALLGTGERPLHC